MLTADLDAKVSWPNGIEMQGLVHLDYIADAAPWLVHASFLVADVRDEIDIERMALIEALMGGLVRAKWFGTEGAPVQIAAGAAKIRFRITDPGTGARVDFDVRRTELQTFMTATTVLVDIETEKAALAAHLDEALGELDND